MVPPFFALVDGAVCPLDEVEELLLLELPHALRATTEARARTAMNTNLVYLLINPPPPRLFFPASKSIGPWREVGGVRAVPNGPATRRSGGGGRWRGGCGR